jgi:hypothetical protein
LTRDIANQASIDASNAALQRQTMEMMNRIQHAGRSLS